MSRDREDRYKYSEPVTDANLGRDAKEEQVFRTADKPVVTYHDNGGRTERVNQYQMSGGKKVLHSYTVTEYDRKNTKISEKIYDAKNRPK